ncbi:lipocalin-like domain-containing protein [Polaribacter sargassicola]|uniref:lipocalin-like domain-containing protein n=1 Tax=Polaribacter sargassicola TaxID=2836891 RepID=UPI001F18C9BA|nr:lipocalin-like domain-containing protein [Polaribacter sp. DS7-9]MCG1037578.1 hypothetical protein [Polaribacter sp. DS7-9]
MNNIKGELKKADEDYGKYGLTKNKTYDWEDGQRLNPDNFQAGEYEWWYTDGHLANGYFFVAAFHFEFNAKGEPECFITFNLANEEGVVLDLILPVNFDNITAKKEYCDVNFNGHYIHSLDGLNKFEVFIDASQIEGNYGLHLEFEKQVPTFKPGSAHWDADGKYFAWLCTAPSASITGTMTINGQQETVQGSGYHDHNWGNCPMSDILGDWLWSRAEVDGITVVTSSVRFNEQCGGKETKFAYLAKGDNILINAIEDDVICLEGIKIPQPDTGKKTSSDCIYIVEGEEGSNYIRFQGQKAVASFPFGENKNWRTWYTRFVSKTILDLNINGEVIKATAPSTLEVMDFFGEKK